MIEIIELPPRTILGMRCKVTPVVAGGANTPNVIGELWQSVSTKFFSLSIDRDDYPLGVGAMWPAGIAPDGEMIYFAGYEVSQLPQELSGLESLNIPGGRYAALTHDGPMSTLPETVASFYADKLPKSGFERRAGMDLELYLETGAPDFTSSTVIAAPVI